MTSRKLQQLMMAGAFLFPLGVISLTLRASTPDVNLGKELFSKRCSGCHALDSDRVGPRLRGILDRKAGTVKGFVYSDALRDSGITWDEQRLNEWLENTEAVVKDNDMEFRVPNADERASIIAYLKSLGK
jgi:cytochrome c